MVTSASHKKSASMISVLAIDDDPSVLEMYRRAAAKAGFAEPDVRGFSHRGFAALASRRFDSSSSI